MEPSYDLESLSRRFYRDATEADKMKEMLMQRRKELFPDEEIPEYMKDQFNVARAFAEMCIEILKIKQFLGIKESS